MIEEVLANPFAIFGIALAIGYLAYLWSRSFAPVSVSTADKAMPYVGGEPFQAQAYQPSYHFFYVALFFTLVHVAALVLATAPQGLLPYAAVGYLGVVAVAVMILRWEQ
jgi:NADH-quinone oxidoreductase subunit A